MTTHRALLCVVVLLAAVACSGITAQTLFAPAPHSPFRAGTEPTDIAAGNVNGDRHPDLVIANTGSNDMTVLLGDGHGDFRPAPGSPFAAGKAPHMLALGNFNGDRHLDAALTSHDSNSVVVLLGDGRGSFAPAPGSPFIFLNTSNPHNHGVALGDVNGDDHLDITTANQNDASISVLLGDGRSGFALAPGSPFRVGRDPYPHALGDVNGDGSLDIANPNVRGNSVSVLLGDGKAGFATAPGSPIATLARPYFTALADVDGNRTLDLLVSHDDTTQFTILLGDGHGGFRPAPGSPMDGGNRGHRIRVGDVNGDGRADFVTGVNGDAVAVLLGNGRGGFAPAPGAPFAVGRGPWSVALADLNGDGRPDVASANSEGNNVTVLLNQR
ncbi:MAG: FG-GAP repeat domain-containing protein [Candidatus Acidiferrales bacterium]